jgi:hypothetical protein
MNNTFDLQSLQDIVNELRASTPKKELKRYNLNSVENFLIHFNVIKDANDRKLVYQQISRYLNTVKDLDRLDGFTSINLFNQYFKPIKPIYLIDGDFAVYPGNDLLIIALCLGLAISYFASSKFVSYLLLGGYLLYCFRLIRKTRQRKIYGYDL